MSEKEKKSLLPEPVEDRGISVAQWTTLRSSLYPGAKPESVLLVWDYCQSRHLDPMKKPCHIVPMEVKNQDGRKEWRDVILPGIYEVRTTAMRTGQYLGHSKPEYGDYIDFLGVSAPEWCAMTIFRWNEAAKMKCEFPVMVNFTEVVATKDYGKSVNARWTKAPKQMLTKCTEAAGLREAFPDELGGVQTEEEMRGQEMIDITPQAPAGRLEIAMAKHGEDIEKIKHHIAFEEYKEAYDIWHSISDEDRMDLWVAPTKYENAPFTTEERSIMQSDTFKNIGRTTDFGIGTLNAIDVEEDVP